jgi:molybdenum-dependent DNA-binding transcriptional regulator ModE
MSILSSLLRLGQGAPTQQIPTAVQTTEIAQEVAPFIKDILGKSQALYKQRMEEGFVPFEGQTLADVTADQLAAQEGLRGLVGSQAAGLQEAKDLTRAQTQQATAEALQSFMNPIDAGAFGGSRAAMRESQAQDAQARLLADIQAKGDLAAFQDARKAFEDQKTRERFAAEGLSGLTSAEFGARRAELGGLEAVGREEQQRQQQLLDESYKRFLDERRFPEQQLGQYQGFVAGASPFLKTTTTETSPQQFQPSPIASALGTITGGLGAYEQAQKVGLFSKEGGKVEDGEPGGLRGIMIKIIRAQRGKGGDPRSKRAERERTQMQQEDVTRMLEEMDMQAGGLIDLPIVERQRSGRIRGPQDLTPKVDEKEEKIKLLEQQLESLAKEKEAASVVTEQEPPVVTEGEDVNKIMTLDDPRVLGELPLKSVEARRTALENIAAAQEGRKLQAEQLMESQAAGLGEDRELAKQDARIKFLMGLSKGLLTGGTRGGILADLTRGGEEAVKATEGFSKEIRDLNQRERDILAQKMENDYNAEMAVLNTQLQQGALDMELFNSATQLLEANYRKGQRMIQDYTQSQAIADAIIAGVVDQTYETPEAGLKALEGARNIISEEDYIRAKNRINKFKPTTTKKDDNVDDRLKREPRITPSRG